MKRKLSLLLAVVMAVTMMMGMSLTAFAEKSSEWPDPEPSSSAHDGCEHANGEHVYATGATYQTSGGYSAAEGIWFSGGGTKYLYYDGCDSAYGYLSANDFIGGLSKGWYYGNSSDGKFYRCGATPTPPDPDPEKPSDPVNQQAEEKEEESPQVNEENISVNSVVIDKSFVSQGDESVIPGSAYNFSNIKTMKGFATQVTKIAAKNTAANSIEVYSSKPMCFNRELLTSINGTGKSLVYYFTHKGHLYSVTVPAGADPSAILNKGQLEGPLYIGKVLGTTRLIK